MEKSAVAGGYKLLDLLLPAVPLGHLQVALFDRCHLGVHAISTHVRIAAKVVEIVTHRLFAAHRALGVVLGTAEYRHRWPDDAPASERCLHIPFRVFQVVRVGGGPGKSFLNYHFKFKPTAFLKTLFLNKILNRFQNIYPGVTHFCSRTTCLLKVK